MHSGEERGSANEERRAHQKCNKKTSIDHTMTVQAVHGRKAKMRMGNVATRKKKEEGRTQRAGRSERRR